MENDVLKRELVWHRGPFLGGDGTAGGDSWYNGQRLLVEYSRGGDTYDHALVEVCADEDGVEFLLAGTDEVAEFGVDDIRWWALINALNVPPS